MLVGKHRILSVMFLSIYFMQTCIFKVPDSYPSRIPAYVFKVPYSFSVHITGALSLTGSNYSWSIIRVNFKLIFQIMTHNWLVSTRFLPIQCEIFH
jgi:hypothetical protein